MKKQTKIITLVLTCLLLIGAVVGITVSAEETAPTVTIAGQNISYEGAVRVAYYVSTENLGDNSIKMLVSDAAFEIPANVNNPGDGVAVTDVTDSITIDGRGTYSLGYSEGVVPKELRVNIYAVAVVVSEDGTVVANSNKKLYSPYTYAMNRFSQNPGADQLNLYTSLLNYGAAVQGVLMTEDEVLAAGGWADEYFVLKHNTITDGGEPVAANVSYRGLEVNALSVEHAAPKWQGDNKNVIFAGYTDADGNAFYGENYAANWNKVTLTPGYTVLDSNYVTSDGKYITYDGSAVENPTRLNDVTADYFVKDAGTGSSWNSTTAYTNTDATTGYDYTFLLYGSAYVDSGQLVYQKTLTITKVEKDGAEVDTASDEYITAVCTALGKEVSSANAMGYRVGDPYYGYSAIASSVNQMMIAYQLNTNPTTTYMASTKQVYETDLTVNFDRSGGSGHVGQFWLLTDNVGTYPYIWGVDINGNTDNSTYYLTIAQPSDANKRLDTSGKIVTGLKEDVTYNLRFEVYSQVATDGESVMLLKFYLDGQLVDDYIAYYDSYTTPNTANSLEGCKFAIPSNGRDCRFYLDNTYVASEEYIGDYLGLGKYNDILSTEDYQDGSVDNALSLPTYVTSDSLASKIANGATTSFVNYTIETDESGNSYYHYAAHNSSATVKFAAQSNYGDTYVFSTDFKWDGSKSVTTTDSGYSEFPWFLRLGMRSVGATRSGGDDNLFYIQCVSGAGAASDDADIGVTNDDLWLIIGKNGGASTNKSYTAAILERGLWYNLRVEYTPISCTEAAAVKDKDADKLNGVANSLQGTIDHDALKSVGNLKLYVNGGLVYDADVTATESQGENCSNVNNLSFDHFYIQGRGGSYLDDTSYCLDNTYCSALTKNSNTVNEDPVSDLGYVGGLDYNLDELTESGNSLAFSGFTLNESQYKTGTTTLSYGIKNWARIAAEGNNNVLEAGSQKTAAGKVTWSSQSQTGDTYVYSTDLKWLGSGAMPTYRTVNGEELPNADDRWLFKLGLASSATTTNDKYLVPIFGWANADDNVVLRLGIGKNAPVIATIEAGQWYDLTIEYTPLYDGTAYSGNVVVMIDMDVVYEGVYTERTTISNTDYTGAFIELRNCARDVVMRFDNTYVGAKGDPHGTGAYVNAEETVAFDRNGIGYDYYIGHTDTSDSTIYSIEEIDGALNYSKVAATAANIVPYFGNSHIVTNPTKGIYEFDINVLSEGFAMPESYKDAWFLKMFVGVEAKSVSTVINQIRLYPVYDENDTLVGMNMAANGADTSGTIAYLEADAWHNVRMEMDSENLYVYVDGAVYYVGANMADLQTFYVAGAELRRYAESVTVQLDNVYVGCEGATVASATPSIISGTTTLTTDESSGITNLLEEHGESGNGEVLLALGYYDVDNADLRVGDVLAIDYYMRLNDVQSNEYDGWFVYHGFKNSDTASYKDNFSAYTSISVTDVTDGTDTVKMGSVTYTFGQWYRMTYTLTVNAIDEETGAITAYVQFYVDGARVTTVTNSGIAFDGLRDIESVLLKFKSTGGTSWPIQKYDIDFANVVLTTNSNGGAYTELPAVGGTISVDFEDGTVGSATDSLVCDNGGNTGLIEAETVETAENKYLALTTATSGELRYYLQDTDNATLGTAKFGSRYEATFKIRLNSVDNVKTDEYKDWFIYTGFGSTTYTGTIAEGNTIGNYWDSRTSSATIFTDTANSNLYVSGGKTLEVGEWHEIKVISYVTNVKASTSITLKTFLFLDGELVAQYYTTESITSVDLFGIKVKSKAYVTYDFDIDDISITSYGTTAVVTEETTGE